MKKEISLKTIRLIIIIVWHLIGIIIFTIAFTLGNSNLELRPYIQKSMIIYFCIMPIYAIIINVLKSKQ